MCVVSSLILLVNLFSRNYYFSLELKLILFFSCSCRDLLRTLQVHLQEHGDKLSELQRSLQHLSIAQRERDATAASSVINRDVLIIVLVAVCLHTFVTWLFLN